MHARNLSESDSLLVVDLISKAMNQDEGRWASETLNRHFALRKLGIDDGRLYTVFELDNIIAGISGLHHYEWGPTENVWLGWFALDPEFHGRGFGRKMIKTTEDNARRRGFKKLFIETYQNDIFQRAINFYKKSGFINAGSINNYLPDDSDMIVFMKIL